MPRASAKKTANKTTKKGRGKKEEVVESDSDLEISEDAVDSEDDGLLEESDEKPKKNSKAKASNKKQQKQEEEDEADEDNLSDIDVAEEDAPASKVTKSNNSKAGDQSQSQSQTQRNQAQAPREKISPESKLKDLTPVQILSYLSDVGQDTANPVLNQGCRRLRNELLGKVKIGTSIGAAVPPAPRNTFGRGPYDRSGDRTGTEMTNNRPYNNAYRGNIKDNRDNRNVQQDAQRFGRPNGNPHFDSAPVRGRGIRQVNVEQRPVNKRLQTNEEIDIYAENPDQ